MLATERSRPERCKPRPAACDSRVEVDVEGAANTRCPWCGKSVDPNAGGVHYAVQMMRVDTMGPTTEYLEGMGGFFHPHCELPWDGERRRILRRLPVARTRRSVKCRATR
jgi:hypothetical protein